MDEPAPPQLHDNEVRAVTHYAMCRHCFWQTAPSDDHGAVLARARRHHDRTNHVVDCHTVHAIVIT